MKHYNAFITSDLVLHHDKESARKHAANRYDNRMTKLNNDLTKTLGSASDAYKFLTWLENNFATVNELANLAADIALTIDEEDL